jgi:hypothetical protein
MARRTYEVGLYWAMRRAYKYGTRWHDKLTLSLDAGQLAFLNAALTAIANLLGTITPEPPTP